MIEEIIGEKTIPADAWRAGDREIAARTVVATSGVSAEENDLLRGSAMAIGDMKAIDEELVHERAIFADNERAEE